MRKLRKHFILISKALKNKGKNYSYISIILRLTYWLLKYRGGSVIFFMLNLHKKGSKIRPIIGIDEFQRIHNKLNPAYYRSLLEDKYIFDRFMKSFNFPLAEMIGIIMNNNIFWIKENRNEPIENILNYELDCYFKMHIKFGGLDVHKLEIHNRIVRVDNNISDLHSFMKMISGAMYVLQKTVNQHPEINRINSSCVNTVRAITIHNGEKAFNFINYLRMGLGNSIVDNITSGGLASGIHEDGTLFDTAIDRDGTNIWLTHHPDSNVAFNSIKVPFFKESLELVVKMHECFHCFFIIGWDIAITESGPVVIEGNPVSELLHEQCFYGGLKKQILEYANSYKKKRGTV